MIRLLCVLLAAAALLSGSGRPAAAAGIENLRVRQDGDLVLFDYDLVSAAERCEVVLRLSLRGRSLEAGRLHLGGDLGRTAPGEGRRIVWTAQKDFPEGFTGPLAGELSAVDLEIEPKTGMVLALIPGRSFEMGCGSWNPVCEKDELPMHRVSLDDYSLGLTEVTCAQFAVYLNAAGGDGSFPHLTKVDGVWRAEPGFEEAPVTAVDFARAKDFCTWLSQGTNQSFDLPSEAQWEYACRGGGQWQAFGTATGYLPPGESLAAPSGANLLGLSAMSGGVWEWTREAYAPYGSPQVEAPADAPRVLRGGRDGGETATARCANRYPREPGAKDPAVGFRVVRER